MNELFSYEDIKDDVLKLFGAKYLETLDYGKKVFAFNGTQYSTKTVPARTYIAQVAAILEESEVDEFNSKIREMLFSSDKFNPLDSMVVFIKLSS